MSLLSVRDLTVTYATQAGPVPAVRGVSFDLDKGEVLGLAGESGCGKTTVVNAVMRLLPPRTTISGQILLNGEDLVAMQPGRLRAVRWAGASVVFQGAMHALDPVQRIGDQIAEAIVIHKQSDMRGAMMRVGSLLEQVGLPARRMRDYPHELSGGQRQRVMIAMALACSPDIVIADEPTTALDVMVQAQVLKLLNELQHELGLAMLFITHDLSVLVEVCDRLAIMYAGKIVEEGPAQAVFGDPAHPYTRALAGAFPAIGDLRYRMAPSGLGGDPPQPEAIPSGCPFHPRCPLAFDACPTIVPDLYLAGEGRRAACLLVEGAPVGASS
jgi:peptide/nickel transport system ATP-binding protein